MPKGNRRFMLLAVLVTALLAVSVAACGGGGSSSSSATTSESSETAPVSEEGAAGGAAAEKVVAPYIGQPSPFPVTEKLKEVPKGGTVAFMDCGSPICALLYELLTPAAKTMGVKLDRIKAGSSASTVNSAFDTVVSQKPDAVLVTAINIELWAKQAEELKEDGIPVVTTGIIGTEPYGIEAPQTAEAASELGGELMANYTVAHMNPEANAVIYEVPELPFSKIIVEKYSEELEAICPKCSVRTAQIGIEEIGNTAPNTVVSDLQSNPDTNVAVFTSGDIATGLPTALKSAGLEVEELSYSPNPTVLQYMKEGKSTAGLGFDLPVLVWTLMDQAAREIVGQKLTGPESEGIPVYQFLTQEDITFDPAKGWSGYPDFVERFEKLWGVSG
jgi:ribose transport system substrate-binding protein